MAPNITGVRAVDQPRAMALAELALELATEVAAPGAAFVVKVFEGEGVEPFVAACRDHFARVRRFKPGASRARSREWYLVAEGRKA
jgi:23S rRNA (uridine2552-2'-O)-methyltransferase